MDFNDLSCHVNGVINSITSRIHWLSSHPEKPPEITLATFVCITGHAIPLRNLRLDVTHNLHGKLVSCT